MADETTNGAQANQTAENQAVGMPIMVNAQYIKDFSFESPNAPQVLLPNQPQPQVNITVDVTPSQIGDNVFEVVLALRAEAKAGERTYFIAELSYGGVFTLNNVPAEHHAAILMIEAPRLLFPFARSVIADATREGGFPPLMINPIDFADLFRRRLAQAQTQAAGNA